MPDGSPGKRAKSHTGHGGQFIIELTGFGAETTCQFGGREVVFMSGMVLELTLRGLESL